MRDDFNDFLGSNTTDERSSAMQLPSTKSGKL